MRKLEFLALIFFILALTDQLTTANAATTGTVVCRVETDRTLLRAGGPQNLVLKVTLDAPRAPVKIDRPRVNIALVLDRSGSMGGTKLEMAKAAVEEAVSRLEKEDVFSLVTYDTIVQTLVPAQKVRKITPILRAVRQIEAGGNTALFGGVSQGAAQIRKFIEGEYIHRVILLSDGLANVGPRLPEDLGRLGAGLFKENISVTTVGVGTDYNEDLMAQLAQRSDGNTYFAQSGPDLPHIFAEELGNVLNVVAQKIILTITLPEGVEPLNIIGREGRIKGSKIQLSMNQLYGGQEKFALIEVRIPQSQAGRPLKIAKADVTYHDPYAMEKRTSTGFATAKFSNDPVKVEASTNVKVIRDYQLNLNAMAQEKAIELSDQGKPAAAAQTLRKSAAKLKAYGGKYQDKELIREAKEAQVQADTLESLGMSKKSRKILRTESYQMKNQQMKK